ncbi:hypothetical protein FOPG_15473 [Fusarium oxysporum f. sp. conglutinans race 2 54008]|uniref:JmjC domain-containing protein n=1 Tax=Fusarium oxysporum f. sp. conglutinans race 2 54008 TaxID=1089457 RepID=X0H9D3_FUSOX|nr:hypothetical protein FOPG_15473 [Fusarium oxysporum f. sp. conglutinans race 2 54008]
MSTHNPLVSTIVSVCTGVLELSSSLSALHHKVRDKSPQTKRQTLSQSIRQVAVQPKTPVAELLVTFLDELDNLSGLAQVILSQTEEAQVHAQNPMVPSNEQVMDKVTNSLQMDSRSETPCERHIDIQLGISEQEVASESQPVGSKDVTMTVNDLAATNSPPDSPKDGGNDINVHGAVYVPTTPSPAKQSARAGLNTNPERGSFARSHSAVTESSEASTAADTSPAGSVATHITWPANSGRACDEDEAMLDVDDGGLNMITDSCSPQHPATNDTASSQSPSVDDQAPRSPTQSPTAVARAGQSPLACAADNRANPPPTVDSDISTYSRKPHADDGLVQVLESAMDILCAVAANSLMQGHSPGNGDDQHANDQQTQSPSPSPASEGSDTASEGADRNTRTNTPPMIQFTPSNRSRSGPPATTVTLTPADMEMLVPRLAEMEREGDSQHFSVPLRNVDLAHMQERVKTTDEKWQTTSTRYKAGPKGEGYARIYVSSSRPPINWEGFTAECKRPTLTEIESIFEKYALDPPQEDIPYYIGNLDILPGERLDPGPEITGNPDLKDLHVAYHHIGGPGSGNRTHGEDIKNFRSYNEVYFGPGYKLWLAIEKHHIAKFNAFVEGNWRCCKCDQFVSHQSLLLAPSRLKKEGIDYIVAAVGRGEAFYTLPGQQHAIINFGHCAAHSINYVPPGEKIDFSKVTACTEDGMYAIGKKYGQTTASPQELAQANKRKAHQQLSQVAPKRLTRTNTAPQRELVEIEQGLSEIPYRRIQIDHQHPSTAELNVYKQVAAVRSTMAIQQFITLVKDWKNEEATVHIDKTKDKLNQSVQSVKFFEGRTKLSKFGLRLTQRKLAREADTVKGPIQKQLKPGFLDKLAADHCMTKDRLKDHIQEGRQWNFICQSHDGLLPFILLDSKNPFGIKKQNWTNLYREEFTKEANAFRSLLDDEYMRNLCEAGKSFEDRVLEKVFNGSVSDTGGFLWEENELDPASDNIDELLKQQVTRNGGT